MILAVLAVPTMGSGQEQGVADVLRPYVERGTLAGAVTLVADREKVLSLEAVGFADVGAKRPMRSSGSRRSRSRSRRRRC